jgi:F-type H+-transporting ATPase subunit b
MQTKLLKRLVLVFLALTLVMAILPAASFAQETGTDHAADTTAEEAGAGPLDALGINGGFLLAQIVNFLIIFAALTMTLWGPASRMLDSRSAKIQKGLEDAAAAARARQNAEAEADKILAEARSERQKLLEEARQQGEEIKKGIESDARQGADRIRSDAQADALTARDAELANLRDQVLQISGAVAGRILGENIDAKKNSQLVSDFFTNLPAGARSLSGAVSVTSAMPLTDAEKKKVESAIKGDSYHYSVDPNILGGLLVRSQDKVVDGSVRSGLNDLASNLK